MRIVLQIDRDRRQDQVASSVHPLVDDIVERIDAIFIITDTALHVVIAATAVERVVAGAAQQNVVAAIT